MILRWASMCLFSLMLSYSAFAAQRHAAVVVRNPVNYTPQLVETNSVSQPHIDALARVDNTIYAGGLFRAVETASGSKKIWVKNFVAFNANTGQLRTLEKNGYKDPEFNGQIWAIAKLGDNLFVGGDFTSVNGLSRHGLVKIDAKTGKVMTDFNAGFNNATVWDLKLWRGPDGSTPRLIAAGNFGGKLIALNPRTGQDTKYIRLGISNALPNAWGGVAVYKIAINPQGTKLIATGNFQTVAGKDRARFFMAALKQKQAELHQWYYPGFRKRCASRNERRVAYLQGIDFAPDGRYFVVTATGGVPDEKRDIWPKGAAKYHTVCDASARFNLDDDQKPVWINYTGGDSVWTTAVTGAAVYVQGHFEWLNNPNGRGSQNGGGAVRRRGIGAIDPSSGKALAWNPDKPAIIGGKAFLTTANGLWVGSDSVLFANESHRGIAYVPLP
jgi:hypothetical protein